MTNEEAKIIIGNIPIKPETLDDCYDITEYQEAKAMAIKALEQQSCEKCEQPDENDELLSPDERADVLNAINDMLEEKGFDLEVGGYEDNDGVFFDVMLMRR